MLALTPRRPSAASRSLHRRASIRRPCGLSAYEGQKYLGKVTLDGPVLRLWPDPTIRSTQDLFAARGEDRYFVSDTSA